jgi:hypothetical protein
VGAAASFWRRCRVALSFRDHQAVRRGSNYAMGLKHRAARGPRPDKVTGRISNGLYDCGAPGAGAGGSRLHTVAMLCTSAGAINCCACAYTDTPSEWNYAHKPVGIRKSSVNGLLIQ